MASALRMCRRRSHPASAGQNIAENIEGRERYPINVRYSQDFRDSVDRMRSVLIATPSGAQIPLSQVAQVSFSHGPAMIRDEDGQLTGYVYIDLKSTNYGGFVDEANRKVAKARLRFPRATVTSGRESTSFSCGQSSGLSSFCPSSSS